MRFQQLAGTRFHRRSSGLQRILKKLLYLGAQTCIVSRKICQSLESERPHDRAAVVEVALQCGCSALAFWSGKAKPRNHGREMPAQLDLFGFGEEAEEFCFVAIDQPRLFCRNFFCRVCCAHPYNWIFVPEALDEFAKPAGRSQNKPRHFVRPADGATV